MRKKKVREGKKEIIIMVTVWTAIGRTQISGLGQLEDF